MEQTALRPRPMPGREPDGERAGGTGGRPDPGRGRRTTEGGREDGPGPVPGRTRPHAARRRGRRPAAALFTALVGTVLVLAGVGLGATGAAVIGADGIAELRRQAGLPVTGPSAASGPAPQAAPAPAPPAARAPAPAVAGLGLEVADDRRPGALVVGVHVPGPGYAAGLVRGDVLLALDATRIDTAADLARAVARARPGREVTLTVRHRSGAHQQLTAVPGIVT
ncbi:PDZ domain-containing protein [Streptomyces sp. enrichment culture]|uniref:PDZ domain-containing protein n=1 Tax=Streptomyces sp. enrichment culture TaxID=1795815 RepID=UPI003F550738